ncbi:MAG TPA: Fe-S cluster assembly protein SufD [Bacteroidales bacterium]|nr:Fe-S cluster assembly protein SufD [Bacteroidales bacterium]
MSITSNTQRLQVALADYFYANENLLVASAQPALNELRKKAIADFQKSGFPNTRDESWRFTDMTAIMQHDYDFSFENQSRQFDISTIFSCEVNDLDTYSITMLNGWCVYQDKPLTRLNNGVVLGSLAKAIEEYPNLVEKYIGQAASKANGGFAALNAAFLQDGLFVYVPKGVKVEKPIQLINIVDTNSPTFIQPRTLIIAEQNSHLSLVHCDHDLAHTPTLTNAVLEIFVMPGASIDHCKVQNKGRNSALLTSTYYRLHSESRISSNIMTLNGGFTRNTVSIDMIQPHAQASISGLYLADKEQFVDNLILANHAAPDCVSNQLFKGIIDDDAKAVFSGAIHVQRDAQRTQAYQNSKNLLLTQRAKVNTQPQLEIYADDVKCSHGATIGQLDTNALFYLRSRGISEKSARQLLMHAFADEVVKKITIEPLKQRIANMVEKRLKGELSLCDQCVLHCSDNIPATFNLNIRKI